ncbi:MAG: cbb3-type cytochrome oxidase assembly protein CcoS [Cellvibrio sp.]
MESLFFLVPAVLIFLGIAIRVLYWALNNGQYDNLNTEAHRILFDPDDLPKSNDAARESSSQPSSEIPSSNQDASSTKS